MKRAVIMLVLLALSSRGLLAKGWEWTPAAGAQVSVKGATSGEGKAYQNPKNTQQFLVFAAGFAEGTGVLIDLETRDLFAVPKSYVTTSGETVRLNRKISSLEKMKTAVMQLDRGDKQITIRITEGQSELNIRFPKP